MTGEQPDPGTPVRKCRLVVQCEQRWSDLEPSDDPDRVRFCRQCMSDVYYCADQASLERAAAAGHCVAAVASLVVVEGRERGSIYDGRLPDVVGIVLGDITNDEPPFIVETNEFTMDPPRRPRRPPFDGDKPSS